MKLSLGDYYEVETEVPVGELPRRADLVLVRRERADPPFTGLWMHLTRLNLFEYKGPTDSADELDLDLLMHVGTGLLCRYNEEKRGSVRPGEMSLWYVVPSMGEAFWGRAQSRAFFDAEGGGLWRGKVWGYPIFLLDYSQADPGQLDALPLNVLRRDLGAPPAMRDLLLSRIDLLGQFKNFLVSYQPSLWEALRLMAQQQGTIDWEAVGKVEDLRQILPFIPTEQIIQSVGEDKLRDIVLAKMTPEQLMELARQKQQEQQ